MNKKMRLSSSILLVIFLSSCSGQKASYRAYEKQVTPSDIKISRLDLASREIELRFEYRSYLDKTLENIQCDIEFNKNHLSTLNQQLNIKLDAFSIEILNFSEVSITNQNQLSGKESIRYSQICRLKFNSGRETVHSNSVLHLAPGSQFKYR